MYTYSAVRTRYTHMSKSIYRQDYTDVVCMQPLLTSGTILKPLEQYNILLYTIHLYVYTFKSFVLNTIHLTSVTISYYFFLLLNLVIQFGFFYKTLKFVWWHQRRVKEPHLWCWVSLQAVSPMYFSHKGNTKLRSSHKQYYILYAKDNFTF